MTLLALRSTLFPYTTLFRSPASMRNTRNPIPLTDTVLAEGRAHWADHCATCHANEDRKSTRLNSSHRCNSYAVFCLKKKIAALGSNTTGGSNTGIGQDALLS